jgi:hypothetical protein
MKKYFVNITFIAEVEAKNQEEAETKAVDMIKGPAGIEHIYSEEDKR